MEEEDAPQGAAMEDAPQRAASSTSGGSGTSDMSWKKLAGRKDGDPAFKLGDLVRGSISRFQEHANSKIRDFKHEVAEKALDLRDAGEKRVAEIQASLLEPEDGKEQAISPERRVAASQTSAAERWWCQACQLAHTAHRRSEEPQEMPAGAIGVLQVRVLDVQTTRSGGEAAVEPVCQFALEGITTGALGSVTRIEGRKEEDEDAASRALECEVRLHVQELDRTDLQLHVWDRQSSRFSMGFEDQAFCGGAFVPLSAILRLGSHNGTARLMNQVFEVRLNVNLLPLKLIRARRKLEPGEASGVSRPKAEHGHAVLELKLTLQERVGLLLFAEPDGGLAPTNGPSVTSLGGGAARSNDPMSTLKAAHTVIGRTGRALEPGPWAAALDELREAPASALLLQLWWAYVSLMAPIWMCPVSLVSVLPALSWKLHAAVARNVEKERWIDLYLDESSNEWGIDRVQAAVVTTGVIGAANALRSVGEEAVKKAANKAANVQRGIELVTDRLATVTEPLEKLKYILAMGDPCTSMICGAMVFVAAVACGVLLEILFFLARRSLLRPLALWPPISILLLPRALREAVGVGLMELRSLQRRVLGDKLIRRLRCFWLRLPNAAEDCHRQLCERYVYKVVETCR